MDIIRTFAFGEEVMTKRKGRKGEIIKIPDDYSFADPNNPFKMSRLVYVYFEDIDEVVLIPESRIT